MPHTSHKKRRQQQQQRQHEDFLSSNKRGEIKSCDGWIRIVRSGKGRGVNSSIQEETHRSMGFTSDDPNYRPDQDEGLTRMTLVSDPAEIPDGASLQKAVSHYQKCNASWKQSRSWAELKRTFDTRIPNRDLDIATCICFGLSSPTGLISRGSDRRNVAMYQLAAFISVVDILTEKRRGQRPEAFAQEPIFNTLDIALLTYLNIKVVEHPDAFNLITLHTFAFCPGAEQFVVRGTLSRSPAMYMGSGPLETYLDPHTGILRSPDIGSILIGPDDPPDSSSVKEQDPGMRVCPEEIGRQQHHDAKNLHGELPMEMKVEADIDEVRGARILHRFKEGKESFRLPDLEAHDYALYNIHLFWRRSSENQEEMR